MGHWTAPSTNGVGQTGLCRRKKIIRISHPAKKLQIDQGPQYNNNVPEADYV